MAKLARGLLFAAFLLVYPVASFGNIRGRDTVDRERLTRQLKRHEGLRLKPYHCSEGVWTVGYGHNLQSHGDAIKEITPEQAEAWLQEDIDDAIQAARKLFPSYGSLTEPRQEVLVNMAYNLGPGSLAAFRSFARAVGGGQWRAAQASMLASKWAKQVGSRAIELAEQMGSGIAKET